MKKSFLVWNKDAVDDEKILMDLEELSEEKLKISAEELQLADIKQLIGKKKKKTRKK
jgi:hypothetical protein